MMDIMQALISLYNPRLVTQLVALLQSSNYGVLRYLWRFWNTQNFAKMPSDVRQSPLTDALIAVLRVGILVQIGLGAYLLVQGLNGNVTAGVPFGLALILSYPVIAAHVLALAAIVYKLFGAVTHPKVVGKRVITRILAWQVTRLRARHKFQIVAVAGSIGKTSTKLAIARLLSRTKRVAYQEGNYNVDVTVPLVIFDHTLPGLFNIVAWTRIFIANERKIRGVYEPEVVVLELGTDGPGQIRDFAYLHPDVTIVTAITPEHMEFFHTLDAVAVEELTVCDFSKRVIVNSDDTPHEYLADRHVKTFGTGKDADYRAIGYLQHGLEPATAKLKLPGEAKAMSIRLAILGEQGVKIALAAAAAAHELGLSADEIRDGLAEIRPFAGRMQVLKGIKDSTVIDDTYNASPAPVMAALDVLYGLNVPQRIAILGTMNELGDYSPEAHREVGDYCRPDKLDFLVTIGSDAKRYLAEAARANGCRVESFDSPYAAGEFVRKRLKEGAVVLAEGSQNRVFAEESLKPLLKDPADSARLVRQSAYWMRIKRKQFSDAT